MEEALLSDQDYGPGHLSAPRFRFDIFVFRAWEDESRVPLQKRFGAQRAGERLLSGWRRAMCYDSQMLSVFFNFL